MKHTPLDTTHEALVAQRDAVNRLSPASRVGVATDLSDAVRDIHIAGLRARNPDWTHEDAIRSFIRTAHGVAIPPEL